MLHFNKLISIIILFAISFPTHADINKSKLDQLISTYIQNKPVKSMIYGLWIEGKPISVNALGISMTDVPANINMHYRIGGITETMLTATLMLMVKEQKIHLTDNIALLGLRLQVQLLQRLMN